MKSSSQPASTALIQHAAELLAAESTLVLALADPQGQTQATPLFYLPAEASPTACEKKNLDLFWLSSPTSLHSLSLTADPRASVAIHHATFAWKEIAGVQMRGLCSVVTGRERTQLLKRYRQRFHLNPALGLALRQSTLYRFRPTWVRILDNRLGFGWKAEFFLENEDAAMC